MQQEIVEGYRLSPQQQRHWLLYKNSRAYYAQCALTLAGPLQPSFLKEALARAVERHEILHTAFRSVPGMEVPLQVILESHEPGLCEASTGRKDEREEQSVIEEHLRQERLRGFDYGEGGLLRACLLTFSAERHALLLTLPAMCADSWTLKNLAREIGEGYSAASRGGQDEREVVQYADFAEWQHELLESEEQARGREYWHAQNLSEIEELRLPYEAEGAAETEFAPESLTVMLEPEVVEQVSGLATRLETETGTVLLACLHTLLWRLTGESDPVVQCAFNGRKYEDLHASMGLFTKHLPVRCHFEEGFSFQDILRNVNNSTSAAQEWLEYFTPAEGRGPASDRREGSQAIAFEYEEWPAPQRWDDVTFTVSHLYACTDRFKLKLSCVDAGAGALSLQFHYDPSVYEAQHVRRLTGEFVNALRSAVREPQARVSELDVLDEAERRQLLTEWNETATDYPRDLCIHTMFEAQVERTPDSVAVIYGAERITYAELNARANRIAHRLRAMGVGPETMVGLLMERSAEVVAGLLGILKAGGAYVPLDPSTPSERLSFMLEDTQVSVLLTQEPLLSVLPAHNIPACCVDSDAALIAEEAASNPFNLTLPEQTAYVIYTSGSTGRPKGVMIQHHSVLNLCVGLQKGIYAEHPASLRVSVNASLSFDASVKQLMQLLDGHTLCPVPEEVRRDGEALLRFLQEYEVEVLDCTPSQLRLLLEAGLRESGAHSLRAVLVGGEEIDRQFWARLCEDGQTAYYNVYGPTECTVDATLCRLSADLNVPVIGRPLVNTRLYVLDARLRPVPMGTPGELCIGGAGLARGYLGRPDVTAEKFIADPFGSEAGARLYRTGDLVRYLPDGNLEFLGRIDQQVKIRGYRIELGEIEAVLSEHRAVQEAVVLAREDEPGDKRLVAYLVPKQQGQGAGDGKMARLGSLKDGQGAEHSDAALRALADSGAKLYQLPNNLEVFHQNRNETEFIYKQIFQDQLYLKHNISLEPGACVFDVGANIGLFTLFVYHHCHHATVYSFEPIPSNFEKLRGNVALYGLDANLFNCGLSNRAGQATFTFYPNWSASSGLYADLKEEEDALKTFLNNQGELVAQYADQLVEGRYKGERVVCELKTLSEVISQYDVQSIDLLKLDVEKSEIDVLNGIREGDWEKINQIVIEVHDINGRLEQIDTMLKEKGFNVVTEQDPFLRGTGIYTLYARKSWLDQKTGDRKTEERKQNQQSTALTSVVGDETLSNADLRQYLREKLPEYMMPSAFVLLDKLPLTNNGKIDRRALPAPEETEAGKDEDVQAPRTPVEQIVSSIWSQLLNVKQVGVDDNFFELGGHSLLATQVMSRLREAFSVEIPLRQLFESPTVSALSLHIESALRQDQHLLAPPILHVDRDQPLPLSFAQQRLWFIDQLQPGSSLYHNPGALRLLGHLDIAALELTFTEILRRHEVLRTTFSTHLGQPVQVIHPAEAVTLPLVDLSTLEETEREAEALRLAAEEAQHPFDLSRDSLLRLTLLKLSEEHHILLFKMHHIITDGWSLGILVKEVANLYAAYVAGEESPLPELPVQYADFAVWQRQWLTGEVLEKQLSYWREQLAGAPAVLELPTDHPRPALQSYRGGHLSFHLSSELSRKLKELSQQQGVTLFMTLLAAFQSLLARYSGQLDIVVGADVANRNRAETESLIGFFVNMLVLRSRLHRGISFSELLKQVREVCLGAYAHQDLPFEKLVEELEPERSLSHTPLFQVLFVLQNAPMGELQLPGLSLSRVEVESETAKFDLLLSMEESEERLAGVLEYNAELYETETIARMAQHLEQMLEAVVENPEAEVLRIELLREAEQHQMLHEWNQTATEYPRQACIHQLFEEQVQRTPEKVALISGDEQLSYAELNSRANQLAHHLLSLGVGPEVMVGLFLHRSPSLIISLLAILKAGGSYVPLDPEYPLPRLSFMLEDAALSLLLTSAELAERLPAHWGQIISLDEEAELIGQQSAETPASTVSADNAAYVMYTSGSTGVPKGVCVLHRGVVRLVRGSDYAALGAAEVHLQLAPVSFDASTFEIWGALLNGGQLVLMPAGQASLEEIGAVIREHGVSTLWLTAGLFHLMVDHQVEALKEVRQLLAGGDVLSVRHVEKFLSVDDGMERAQRRLINGYGPTENTTFTCCYSMEAGVEHLFERGVPIGRPISNTEVYVLDEQLQPVPVGVVGELYTSGDGLSRGYLTDAELTAEKFLPHPYSRRGGERMYRTGDQARYRADGVLEFVGRADQQVKVRGYRIEVGEIEAALKEHEGVRESVVEVRGEGSEEKRLVAYVVKEAGEGAISGSELRGYLRERLPEYMVVQQVVFLDELPLNSNGKVDRRALPEPAVEEERGGEYEGPRGEVEELVCRIWEEVLGVTGISRGEDFFELGGHSLLATQVVSRMRDSLGVEVTLRQLFEQPTVAGLSEVVEKAKAKSSEAEAQASTIAPISREARRVKRSALKATDSVNSSVGAE